MVSMTRVNIVNRQSLKTRKGYPRLGILFIFYSPDLIQAGAFRVSWCATTADVVRLTCSAATQGGNCHKQKVFTYSAIKRKAIASGA